MGLQISYKIDKINLLYEYPNSQLSDYRFVDKEKSVFRKDQETVYLREYLSRFIKTP